MITVLQGHGCSFILMLEILNMFLRRVVGTKRREKYASMVILCCRYDFGGQHNKDNAPFDDLHLPSGRYQKKKNSTCD